MKIETPLVLTMASVGAVLFAGSASAQDDNTNKWATSINAGATLSRGNADTTLVSAGIDTQRKYPQDYIDLGINGVYGNTKLAGEHGTTETADQLKAYGQYNHDFTSMVYGYFHIDGLHDGIADIQYRLSLSPGVGIHLIKNNTFTLDLEGGPGFIAEKYGSSQYLSYVTLRFAEKGTWQISEHAKAWESAEYLPEVDKFSNYILNFEVGIETSVSQNNRITLRAVADDTYNSDPALGRQKNDLKLIVGLGYKF